MRFPCVHAAATTPVQRLGVILAHPPGRISLPRFGGRVGLHIDLFEACSAITRVAACTLAQSRYFVTALSGGFRHFVASMPAPVASGGSEFAGWDLHPLESAALSRRTRKADTRRRRHDYVIAPQQRRVSDHSKHLRCRWALAVSSLVVQRLSNHAMQPATDGRRVRLRDIGESQQQACSACRRRRAARQSLN